MSARRPPGGYEVGYGKPPKEHQFKPGQTGNPKGRKKKAKRLPDIATALDAVLSRRMTINDNGQTRTADVLEAMILNLLAAAARGNFRALQTFVKLVQTFPPTEERFYGYDPKRAEQVRRKLQDMIERREELERLRAGSQARTGSPNSAPPPSSATGPEASPSKESPRRD
jgi:hypothetical protein